MWVAFAFAKAAYIFCSKNSSVYAIFNDQSLNGTSTNNIVSYEQMGPENDVNTRVYSNADRMNRQKTRPYVVPPY